ncbi:hypothetical protein J1614_008188 [Plenodomus biglobosus]|nr:hypothetical protein J1614_008188 [Plenodomus biglobosus]
MHGVRRFKALARNPQTVVSYDNLSFLETARAAGRANPDVSPARQLKSVEQDRHLSRSTITRIWGLSSLKAGRTSESVATRAITAPDAQCNFGPAVHKNDGLWQLREYRNVAPISPCP